MPAPLYRRHSAALAATYADVENHALNQDEALVGTPGAISVRENANKTKYYVRQYYDFEGRKRDQYLGKFDPESGRLLESWRKRIDEAKEIQSSVRLLAREGYSILHAKHLAALAPLSRHRIFEAGAVLVGTHAFELIVNRLGVRVAVFATEDVDIARPAKLALDKPPAGTAQPYLRYLLSETQMGAAISPHGVVAVRIPIPERFAIHKLIVAQLRAGRPEKSRKDLKQAAALIAALGELQPGALHEAFGKTATSTRKHIRNSLRQVRSQLEAHPQAWDEMAAAAKL